MRNSCEPSQASPQRSTPPFRISASPHPRIPAHVLHPRSRRRHGATPEHSPRVPLLDRARLAGRDRDDRARRRARRGERRRAARVRHRDRGVQLDRSRVAAARRDGVRRRARRRVAAPDQRAEIRLYTAAVLRHVPEEPLQPVPMGTVFLADESDVAIALRMDGYLKPGARTGIPDRRLSRRRHRRADLSRRRLPPRSRGGAPEHHAASPGSRRRRARWSGCCSRSSRTSPQQKGSVAAVCFNVKGPDLCFLDQPGEIDEADRALYEKCGVSRPSRSTTSQYFAPYKSDGVSLNTLRSNEALLDNVTPLTWGLREVLQYAEVLLNKDDVDAKADALIDFIKENVLDKEFADPMLERPHSVHVVRRSRRLVPRRAARAWRRRTTRAGAPTTSRRSARCGTGSPTSRCAARGSSPTTGPRATSRSGAFRIARCMSSTSPDSRRTRRI